MKKRVNLLARATVVALTMGMVASCSIDDTYDIDKEFDMTVGIGADGLALRLGNTEPVYLNDVLDIEDNDLIDTDQNHLYYLVKSDNSQFDVTIGNAVGSIDGIELNSDQSIVSFADVDNPLGLTSVTINQGEEFNQSGVTAESEFDASIDDIAEEVNSIRRIVPESSLFNLRLEVYSNNPDLRFNVTEISNLKLKFPDYLEVEGTAADNVLDINIPGNPNSSVVDLGQVRLIDLLMGDDDQPLGLPVTDDGQGNRVIDITGMASMSGDFKLTPAQEQTMNDGDEVRVRLVIELASGGEITVASIDGEVNPAINPDMDPIEISDDLPDFLRDEAVTLEMQNPTIKFDVDATQLPVPVEFSGEITSYAENGSVMATASLPQSGKVDINKGQNSVYYFSQEGSPYDPTGIDPAATVYTVDNLSDLVRKLPDNIQVDCNDGRVNVKQGVLHSIALNRTYSGTINYDVLVPFIFNSGMTIVYTDSIADMNEDLKDYQAEGFDVTGEAYNTVPMELVADIEPLDLNGNVLTGITVTPATIAAGTGLHEGEDNNGAVKSNITITLTAQNPADVSRIDKLRFHVTAGSEAQGALYSNQYFSIQNLRLKLKGQIIGDFN